MRPIRFSVSLVGLLAAMTTSALAGGPTAVAAETPVAAAVTPAGGHDWSGLYLGLGLSKPDGSEAWYDTSLGGGYGPSASWQGNQGILAIGYNLQRGKLVYGAELSYSPGTISARIYDANQYVQQCTIFHVGCYTEVSDMLRLGARIGTTFDRSLFYVSASWTSANVESGGMSPQNTFLSDRVSGYSIGIGTEFALNDRLSLRGEYSRTRLEQTLFDQGWFNTSTAPEFDSVMLGINLSF